MSSTAASKTHRGILLYRSVLRAHKNHLPKDFRQLGDTYVKAEFRAHREAKPEHLPQFYREWEKYLDDLLATARTRESLTMGAMVDPSAMEQAAEAVAFGKELPREIEVNDEQKQQLEAIRREAEKLGTKQK